MEPPGLLSSSTLARQSRLPDGVRLASKDVYVPAGRVGIYWLYQPEDCGGANRD